MFRQHPGLTENPGGGLSPPTVRMVVVTPTIRGVHTMLAIWAGGTAVPTSPIPRKPRKSRRSRYIGRTADTNCDNRCTDADNPRIRVSRPRGNAHIGGTHRDSPHILHICRTRCRWTPHTTDTRHRSAFLIELCVLTHTYKPLSHVRPTYGPPRSAPWPVAAHRASRRGHPGNLGCPRRTHILDNGQGNARTFQTPDNTVRRPANTHHIPDTNGDNRGTDSDSLRTEHLRASNPNICGTPCDSHSIGRNPRTVSRSPPHRPCISAFLFVFSYTYRQITLTCSTNKLASKVRTMACRQHGVPSCFARQVAVFWHMRQSQQNWIPQSSHLPHTVHRIMLSCSKHPPQPTLHQR